MTGKENKSVTSEIATSSTRLEDLRAKAKSIAYIQSKLADLKSKGDSNSSVN